MDPAYEARRLVDVARALRLARRIAPRERWPRERLERHQRAALDALVRHAVAHSPFYRERLGGLVGADLQALPVLDKATMMERFDELVCDPRLRRDALFEHLDGLDRDALYLGEYRGMTTSGSSGRKGLFVYDRRGWVGILAQFFRVTTFTGARPRVPRLRVAAIGGGAPTHMTRRCADSVSVGLHRVLSLPVTMPLPRLVAALNEFRPQYLNAYPSMAALLADEQLRGRLRIAPEIVSTSSELLTPAVADRIEEAFGRRPYDLYGTTEGLWGGSCVPGGAMHLFEDMTIVEDDGDRILVTNLFNRVQPLIRFEVTDVMRFADEPCPCGRTLRKLEAVEGRADDVLRLDGVAVMPAHFSVLTADREVREFQVVQRGGDLRVRVALAEGAAVPEACTRLRDGLAGRLAALGVRSARVEIEPCDAIARAPSGKLQLVVGQPRWRRRALSSAGVPDVRSHSVATDRLRMHVLESGPADGVPVVMVHGNLSTGRFFEHLMPGAPARYRLIAPDMRSFGDSEHVPIDATRGLRDWADDAYALARALDIERPVHLVGWSTGGAAIAAYALDRPVASLTFLDPVSPYGYGGTRADGTPCYPDYAGSGGGTGSPDFTQRLAAKDRSTESPASPRNVMNASYWAPTHREPREREELLLDEILKSVTGDDGYPGDSTPSENWPGVAPGTRGILNALSPKYCNWSGIVDLDPKPPVLWTHGSADIVVADGSAWEMGTLGKMGAVPGWPGDDVFPPQPMVTQIRSVLERYRAAGGYVEIEMFEGSGHCPAIDAAPRWTDVFFAFLNRAEA